MITYIIFDTNILFKRSYDEYSKFEFNELYNDIQGKIERHDVIDKFELYVPEISVQELFQQQLQSYEDNLKSIIDLYPKFENIYEIDLQIDELFNYQSFLEIKKNQYLKKNDIKLLEICKEERFSKIVERALNKQAPFEGKDKKSDKGFKDALIWESILEFAEKNTGEYIFFTADKGFKGILENEFKNSTNQSLKIYSKEDRQKLDYYIEEYSTEKNIKTKLNKIESNLLLILPNLLNKLKTQKLSVIEINGVLCEVNKIDISSDIIDLNEVGDFLCDFKIKGSLRAEKPGIQYDLKISLEFVLETEQSSSEYEIIKIDLENTEGFSLGGDPLTIQDIDFSYYPLEEDDEFQEEAFEEEENEDVLVGVKESTNNHSSVISKDKKDIKVAETGENYKEDIDKNFYFDLFSELRLNLKVERLEDLIELLEGNLSLDWFKFDSKIALIRREIKKFLRKNKFEEERISEVEETIMMKLLERNSNNE